MSVETEGLDLAMTNVYKSSQYQQKSSESPNQEVEQNLKSSFAMVAEVSRMMNSDDIEGQKIYKCAKMSQINWEDGKSSSTISGLLCYFTTDFKRYPIQQAHQRDEGTVRRRT